ncbi:MAG: DNA polymerase III subunit epsilon [Alphaproteobacteria bacterium]|nr:DNA polymerase III subunit epsilon [Alphaproteobacteria bacterium]
MREIILDTETTGLSPAQGHRIIEIGCIELFNHLPTGKFFHAYINPERDVPEISTKITGLTTEFLKPHPIFEKIVHDFLSFIGDDPLVIHNADFDMAFLNAELGRVNLPVLPKSRAIDTLYMARQKFPGSPASLDALCKRFNVDLSKRDKHGALLDSELLAQVYLELLGGRQRSLELIETQEVTVIEIEETKTTHPVRVFEVSEVEKSRHQEFLSQIKSPLWGKILSKK